MAYHNRARMTTATTGTGAVTLGTAVAKYQTFATSGAVDQEEVYYAIEDGSAWEIGVGIYTATGTTMTRVLLESSTTALLSLSGTAEVFLTAPATYLGRASKVETFTPGTSTWTKAAGAKRIVVACVGPGSGGASGSKGALGTARVAGNGGGGGGISVFEFAAANLPATLTVTVGAAGIGGSAVTAASTAGAYGTDGSDTSFGLYLKAQAGHSGSGYNGLTYGGNNGGAADSGGGTGGLGNSLSGAGPGGGSSGGGINASNTAGYGGANSPANYFPSVAGLDEPGGQVAPGQNGIQGSDRAAGDWRGGWQGSGGGGATTGNGGTGGKGGNPGGGGGGGGAATNAVGNSGAGGNGGDGRVVVITYY